MAIRPILRYTFSEKSIIINRELVFQTFDFVMIAKSACASQLKCHWRFNCGLKFKTFALYLLTERWYSYAKICNYNR